MGNTKIDWATKVWNPVTGCTKVSEGCRNCYAERMAKRLAGRAGYPEDGFKVTLHPDKLDEPLRWKKPARIFVCSMGDIFHPAVTDSFLTDIWMKMRDCRRHTFIILTKRIDRALSFIRRFRNITSEHCEHIQIGPSIEDQQTADERIPLTLEIKKYSPSIKVIVSFEPALGPVDLDIVPCPACNHPGNVLAWPCPYCKGVRFKYPDWVIMGGESGPGARPMHPDWARSVRDQCQAAGVPYFFKQWGEWLPEHPDIYRGEVNKAWYGQYGEFHGAGDFVESCMCVEGTQPMIRVGKKAAGCLLDGKLTKERP